jgi:uncharacterized membrane protein (Fun14 family)
MDPSPVLALAFAFRLGDVDLATLGLQFGTGGVIGGLIGVFLKKVAKLVAFIVGAELALFAFLESRGILRVRWDRLTAGLVGVGDEIAGSTPPSWVMTVLSTLSVSAGFTGGFLLGFRRG